MFDELLALKNLFLRQALAIAAASTGFFFFGPGMVTLFGYDFAFPVFAPYASFSAWVLRTMQAQLLPNSVSLVALGPFSAFNTQVSVALLLGFLVTFPLLVYRVVSYLSPALRARERSTLITVLLPAIILFFGGAAFAWFYIIPATLTALYSYTAVSGAIAYFSLDVFVSSVVLFMFATGVFFLLPVFMVLLTALRIIPAWFWRDKWRHALLTFVIASAILTPDGSGVSMVLLAVPLGGLYAVGAGVASMNVVSRTGVRAPEEEV